MSDKSSTNSDRFDKIDLQFDMFSKKFDKIDLQFDMFAKKFDNIDSQFAMFSKKFEKIDLQFDKLTFYMLKRFDNVDKMLDEKADKGDMQMALGLLDTIAKRQETYDQERLVMGHQVSRLDGWTHELANKIGHKLTA